MQTFLMSFHEVKHNFDLQFTRSNLPTNLTLNQLREVTAKEKIITVEIRENQSLSSQAQSGSS